MMIPQQTLPTTNERQQALSKYDDSPWVLQRLDHADDGYHYWAKKYIDQITTAHTILDLGAMGGALIRTYLRPRFPKAKIIGIDLMPKALEYAKKAGGAEYMSVDIDRPLPFPEGAFDLVVGTEVLEHLYRPEVCLDELRRILHPGGQAVFTMPTEHNADGGDHHTFLTARQWADLIGQFLSVQEWDVIEEGKRVAIRAVRRGNGDRKIAFALYSFNRPHYLKKCLASIDAANNKDGIDFYHFQDGDTCFLNNKSFNSASLVQQSLNLVRKAKTPFTIVESPLNYGVAQQQMKSTELLFDQKKYDILIGLVDDYVVSKNFFIVTKALTDQFYWCPRVFSVIHTCYIRTSREVKERYLHKYKVTKIMTPPGGWSIYRNRWYQIKERYMPYYNMIKKMNYTCRDHGRLYATFKRGATSHDAGFEWAIDQTDLVNIYPCVNRVIDIGVLGMHKRPSIHQASLAQLRLDEFNEDTHPPKFTAVLQDLRADITLPELEKGV